MNRMQTAILGSIVVLLCLGLASASSPMHIHLTWQDDPTTTITVSWRTNATRSSIVQYGPDESYGFSSTAPPGEIHHVELRDLKPATTYHYRCGSEGEWSDDMSFTTAPSDPDAPFRFVAMGDSRTNMNIWRQVSNAVYSVEPEFVIHTGDLVESGGVQKQWDIWFEIGEQLMSHSVLMPCLGNHENNAPQYFEQFALPGAQQWYSFDYGNAHFVALTTEGPMTGAQRDWLEEDLSSTNALWKFVFYHKPMYSVGSHGPTVSVQNAWGDIFDRYHVDMVFNGHDHIYARTPPIHGGEVANSSDFGTIHIVTGGAGAGLHGIERPDYPLVTKAMSEYHYVLLTINGEYLHMEAWKRDHAVFDVLDINKTLYPDLRISGIELVPTVPTPGSNATLSVEVVNWGHAPSGSFSLKVSANDNMIALVDSATLMPRESDIIQVSWRTPEQGLYNLTAVVDPSDLVDEGILEWNNVAVLKGLVSMPKPDLLPVSLELVAGDLMGGGVATLKTVLENAGTSDSAPFELHFSVADVAYDLAHPVLGAGDESEISLPQVELAKGDWAMNVIVDPNGEVDELYEDNNVLSITVPVRDFVKDGPIYYPKGTVEGEVLVIRYDDVEGALPDSSDECALLWGVNGWRVPRTRPPNSIWAGAWMESAMERGLDGLWIIFVPTDQNVDMVNFKFRNGQLTGRVIDDNFGSAWNVPMRGWAAKAISKLSDAIREAREFGVNTLVYDAILREANRSLSLADYAGAVQIIGNATDVVTRETLLQMYDVAKATYDEAVKDGLSVSRAGVMLSAAKDAIEKNNFSGSKAYLDNVFRMVEEARASINEGGILMITFITLACIQMALQRARR